MGPSLWWWFRAAPAAAGGNRRRRALVGLGGRAVGHWAKQSTAVSYVVGPVLDSAGAEYTGAAIGDLSISKNGGTLTALASAATLTHIANGQYTLSLTTGNTDTLGTARILCNKSTYQMPTLELMILPATVYDALTTNATNATGGLLAATGTVSAAAGYVGASGAAVNGTTVNTLAGHDPGATLGTSTLTQTQVTGGAYALNSASFAFNSGLDLTTTQKSSLAASAVASVTGAVGSVTGNVGGNVTGSVGSVATGGITRASLAADTGLQTIRSNTAQGGSATTITLDASASATDTFYVDCLVYLTGGTGAGQYRIVTGYVGSTKVATVPNWATAPDNTTTFAVLAAGEVSVHAWKGVAVPAADTAGYPKVTVKSGTGTGELNLSSGRTDANVTYFGGAAGTFASGRPEVNATHIAGTAWASTTLFTLASHDPGTTLGTSTLTQAQVTGGAYALNSASFAFSSSLPAVNAALANGGITAATFAAGAIDAAAIAADAIGSSEFAASAASEIAAAVWDLATTGHTTGGTFGAAMNAAGSAGDPWATGLPGAYSSGTAGYILGTNLDALVSSRLAPTVGGRTLDVSAGGEAGVDWANVGSPTTSLNLSGTTISTSQAVASVSGSVGSVTGAVGSVTGSVGTVASGGITAASLAADTGLAPVRSGTLQTGSTSTTAKLDTGASATTNYYAGQRVYLTGGTGAGQDRVVLSYNGTTKVATVSPAWATTPDNTTTFAVRADAAVGLEAWEREAPAALAGGLVGAYLSGAPDVNVTSWAGSAVYLTNGTSGMSPMPAVGTRAFVDVSLNEQAVAVTGTVTLDYLSNLSGGAVALAGSAPSWYAAPLDAAGTRTAVGLASANLDTQLGAIAGYIDTEVAAIKAKTDNLPAAFPANFATLSIDSNGRVKIQSGVTKNTALPGFEFFLCDSSDHATGVTGATVTATRSLDGAAFASCTNGVSEVGSGVYKLDLAAADLNGNVCVLKFAASGADTRIIEIVTTP